MGAVVHGSREVVRVGNPHDRVSPARRLQQSPQTAQKADAASERKILNEPFFRGEGRRPVMKQKVFA